MDTPESVLYGYIAAMNSWERKCTDLDKRCKAGELEFEEADEISHGGFTQIHQRFVLHNVPAHRNCFSDPPEYDPTTEKIMEVRRVGETVVEIDTLDDRHFKHHYTYYLTLVSEGWKLSKKVRHRKDGTEYDIGL